MCVGLSAKVVKISNGTAVIDAGGAKREVSSQLLEDLEPGDYVMVHAGVAIAKITDEDENETDQLMEEFLYWKIRKSKIKRKPPERLLRITMARLCGLWKCAVRILMRFSGWESVNCCQNR